MSSRASF